VGVRIPERKSRMEGGMGGEREEGRSHRDEKGERKSPHISVLFLVQYRLGQFCHKQVYREGTLEETNYSRKRRTSHLLQHLGYGH
jgi:hypothetical protein